MAAETKAQQTRSSYCVPSVVGGRICRPSTDSRYTGSLLASCSARHRLPVHSRWSGPTFGAESLRFVDPRVVVGSVRSFDWRSDLNTGRCGLMPLHSSAGRMSGRSISSPTTYQILSRVHRGTQRCFSFRLLSDFDRKKLLASEGMTSN